MANRGRHYEEAFEDFLAAEGVPYVSVTLAQRQAFQAARIKAFDFVVWPPEGPNWLVDIKGRSIKTDRLENWVTRGDLDGLAQWQAVFGAGFIGAFIFVFHVEKPRQWSYQQAPLYPFGDSHYSFWISTVEDYRHAAEVRSARWQTYSTRPASFLNVAEPVGSLLTAGAGRERGPSAGGPESL